MMVEKKIQNKRKGKTKKRAKQKATQAGGKCVPSTYEVVLFESGLAGAGPFWAGAGTAADADAPARLI